MSFAFRKLSIGPADDGSTVNLSCLLLLQSGGLETSPNWGTCDCAVCQRHRAKLDAEHPIQQGSDTRRTARRDA